MSFLKLIILVVLWYNNILQLINCLLSRPITIVYSYRKFGITIAIIAISTCTIETDGTCGYMQ